MSEFYKVIDNIYRLKFPFDTVYTSVFLLEPDDKTILVDCGTNAFDVENSLISADGLQGAGVDKYRCSLASHEEYLNTLEKIQQDDRIENILFSHAYEPWYSDCVFCRGAVLECINECKKYIGEI